MPDNSLSLKRLALDLRVQARIPAWMHYSPGHESLLTRGHPGSGVGPALARPEAISARIETGTRGDPLNIDFLQFRRGPFFPGRKIVLSNTPHSGLLLWN